MQRWTRSGGRLCAFADRMIVSFQYIAFVTLTINIEAYSRLKKLKANGDTFSEVILRELPEPWDTAGDVLDGTGKDAGPEVGS